MRDWLDPGLRLTLFFLDKYNQWLYYWAMHKDELKLWRKKWGITQVELARMLGTYQVTIARWETGARKIPFLLPLALEALEHRLNKLTKQEKEAG
jgi:predicted transcriptional regulator